MLRFMLVIGLCLLAAPALAQAIIPDPSADLPGFLSLLSELWQGAQWAPLIAVAVVGLVALARRFGPAYWPWLASRYGGLALAAGMALAVSLAQGLVDALPLAQVIANAILATVMAIGGHSACKNAMQGNAPRTTEPA